MSDMKCPVCNKQMKIGTLDTDDGMGTVWMSIMPCDCVCSYGASKAVWQELIRTRKALDVAVDALKKYTDASGNWWYGYEFQGHYEDYAGEYADKALEQITALEQKD